MIRSLQHAGLVVRDLARSRAFYGSVLGMTEIARPVNFTFSGAWFRYGEDEIHLISAGDTTAPPGFHDPGPARQTGLATHLAFEVDDIEAARARILAAGVEIVGGPMPRGDGVIQFYFQDPDGYLLECFQWTGGPPEHATERTAIAG